MKKPHNIWAENPEMFENYTPGGYGIDVFVPDEDNPPILFVPDRQNGGFVARAIVPPKRKLGFS